MKSKALVLDLKIYKAAFTCAKCHQIWNGSGVKDLWESVHKSSDGDQLFPM